MFPIGRGKVLLTDVVLLASSFIIVPFRELVGPATVEDSLVKFTTSLELASGRMLDEELWIVVIFGVVSFTASTRVVPFVMFPIGGGKVLLTDVVVLFASSFIIVPFNTVPLMVL